MGKSDELCAKLDELGVEYTTYNTIAREKAVTWTGSVCKWIALPSEYGLAVAVYKDYLTPEQAIAATVGNRTDLSKRLREVNGLHEFAELFGFDWADDSDWTWHDVARAMADAVDAATAGMTEEEADSRDLMEAICDDDGVRYSMDEALDIMREDVAATVGNVGYGIEFATTLDRPHETMVGETVFDAEENAIGWITNATVGRETLTAEQVRECVRGVYFEGYGDGATRRWHGIEETDWQTIADKLNAMLGAGTCKVLIAKRTRGPWIYHTSCGHTFLHYVDDGPINRCPNCGKRIKEVGE